VKPRILVVDDFANTRVELSNFLQGLGYDVITAADGTEALKRVGDSQPDLVLLDYDLPDMKQVPALARIKEIDQFLPVVMLSAYGTIGLAVEAIKNGAYDWLEKTTSLYNRLDMTIQNALKRASLEREVGVFRAKVLAKYQMIGASKAMQHVRDLIEKAAPSMSSVLILGESGTGKELVARAIHNQSPVAAGRFEAINCSALPQDLVESALFGHEKGAFTGAHRDQPGIFEAANNGTAFLDEIGDMASGAQPKLLRFLQDRELRRVGGSSTEVVNVRVVAATNRDLRELIEQGTFRDDLYQRLAVFVIRMPPLRERREDIPSLATHLMVKHCAKMRVPVKALSDAAIGLLASQDWYPGNVRALEAAVERIVAVHRDKSELSSEDVAPWLSVDASPPPPAAPNGGSLRETRTEADRRHILQVLSDCKWNIAEAARVLGIDRTNVYKALKRLGVRPPTDRHQ
jgi:DNA-binding NtrC family response regulator